MSQSMAYQASQNFTQTVDYLANAILDSKMLGTKSIGQAKVVAIACFVRSVDPVSISDDYDIVNGKMRMKSDAMLAKFRLLGGTHKVVKRDSDLACVRLTIDGESQDFEFSWEDALYEPVIYNGKEDEIINLIDAGNLDELKSKMKPKYRTPRSRTGMLWLRAVSDGVSVMCPEVKQHAAFAKESSIAEAVLSGNGGSPLAAASSAASVATSPVETSVEQKATKVEPAIHPLPPESPCTVEQGEKLESLFKVLKLSPEAVQGSLLKRGVESVGMLSIEQADELIAAMQAAVSKRANASVAETPEPKDQTSAALHGPCTTEQVDECREHLRSIVQMDGHGDVSQRFLDYLNKHGLKKVSDMSYESAREMNKYLANKEVESFFAMTLRKPGEETEKNDQSQAS